jgi:hypothetical protein
MYKGKAFYTAKVFLAILFLAIGIISCNNKSYPCPGLGQSNEADMNMFDEEGKLKDPKNAKSKKSKNNGLVNKKTPKKIKAPRKTHI